ncbi:Glycosyl transferase family 1 [Penicillium fimorum]|uniref:Glycosyl transferase family 1 n=1 Tax=Penicillium fimorum TaxID=1882269 RepID=A0A9X0C482_9EURO|nr:Glycosyl transferase family 1 [Penicillium fimorum]
MAALECARLDDGVLPTTLDKLTIRQEDDGNFTLTALPETSSVAAIVESVLGHSVQLHRLQASGAEGQSGCSIYFVRDSTRPESTLAVTKVYPPACHKDFFEELVAYRRLLSLSDPPSAARPLGVGRTRDENTAELMGVIVYQLAPGKAINTIIRDIGRVSTLRLIAKQPCPDETKEMMNDIIRGALHGISIDNRSHQTQSSNITTAELLDCQFNGLMADLISAVKGVASTLAKLHRERSEWSSASESVVNRLRNKLQGWVQEIQGPSRAQYERAIGSDQIEQLASLVDWAIDYSREEGIASLLHGDASPGNFFWDHIQGITMIDYGGLTRSMDASGRPIGPAEMDAAGFHERLRKYAGDFGMSEGDIGHVQGEFWKAYQAQGISINEGLARLFKTRTQLSRLWSAVDKQDTSRDEHKAVQLNEKVKFEWERLVSISPERVQPCRVLVVANASGPGKGGLPLLNQELVKAMSEIPHASVTLFMVEPENEVKNTLASLGHGRAKVVCIPSRGDDPSALLYHVAKVHQPGDYDLPISDDQHPSPFNLIIGHSRYSSTAASLIRERWYPTAKLALITHTSALRKSDLAWKWYGKTRELGYVEAARLAMLDERILPKADLAVGVGPVLTTEAREREWMGQCNRPRSSMMGPRFHELVPGVRTGDACTQQRQPNDLLRVLLAGRADDPAKGLDDAVYAVRKIALSGNDISLDVLGLPTEDVERWQQVVDEMTGIPDLVRLHPFSDDPNTVSRFYCNADLVIMPSMHEGFGMIFTEVAGLGVPILVTQESGAGQLALDRSRIPPDLGQACVVMDESTYGIVPSPTSQRVAVWAHRIDQVRCYPEQTRRHVRSLQRIMRGYSWKHAAKALLRSAMEGEGDTVQMAHGSIAPAYSSWPRPSLGMSVVLSMRRAARTRNCSGNPTLKQVDEVMQNLPEIAPTISALEEHVSAAVGCSVNLRSLDPTYQGGFSGAIIFFAYANDEFANGEISLTSNDHKGRVLAVIKIFVHGLDNGITEELSSLEWLLLQTRSDIRTAAPLAVGRMTWDTKPGGVVTYQVAPGVSLYQLMMQMGRLPPGPTRREMLSVFTAGVQAVARTLARLHTHSVEGRPATEYLEWYFNAATKRVQEALLHKDAIRSAGFEVDQLPENMDQLIANCKHVITSRPRTTVVHGDAHPGNFFYDRTTGHVTMIDTTTLHCSLDENGEPVGVPERDLGHFVHMLRRTGEQYGLTRQEMQESTTDFMEAYLGNAAAPANVLILRFMMSCSALSFLNYAAQSDQTKLQLQVKILQDLFHLGERWTQLEATRGL